MASAAQQRIKELERAVALLEQQATEQAKVSGSLGAYIEGLKKANLLNQTILDVDKKISAEKKKLVGLTGPELVAQQNVVDILEHQNAKLKEQFKLHKQNLDEVKKTKVVMAALLAGTLKGLGKMPGLVDQAFGKIKTLGLFEMDKAIRKTGMEMGLLGSQTESYRKTVKQAAMTTNEWGMGVEELAKMQGSFSEELGRTVMLSEKASIALSAMAAATGLGAEGAGKFAADMDTQGLSAERTAKYVEQTLNDSSKMGLNAAKVIKNITSNTKMLNKFNFKGGVQGLAKMAKTVTKLGIEMGDIAGMAEKLFDIEGAVDMSAQLQVMGGKWAQLADPFKLMYMARNDMEGLTAALGEAAESAVDFNAKTGEFEISALEMHRLRKVAEQTGVAYETLAEMGKNAARATQVKKQMGFTFDKDSQEFLENTAQFNEKGEAFIKVGQDEKLLSTLKQSDIKLIKNQISEKKTLAERAEAGQSFDEMVTNLVNMFKTTMLPIIEGIDSVLRPLIKDVFKDEKFKASLVTLGESIGGWVKSAAGIIKTLGGWVLELGPGGTLALLLGAKGLMAAGQWLLNGIALGKGFNSVAGGGGGGLLGGLKASGGGSANKGLKMAGGLGIGGALVGGLTSATTDPGSTMNVLGETAAGALSGAAMGAFLGPFGMALGGAIGGIMGGYSAYNSGPEVGEPQNDVGFGDKFNLPKILKNLKSGSNHTEGRGIVEGGKVTPIDNKDALMAIKPGGAVDEAVGKNTSSNTMKIEFGTINVKFDDITVNVPGGDSVKIGNELLKQDLFLRDLTAKVNKTMDNAIKGT